jgi:hypothetical protein
VARPKLSLKPRELIPNVGNSPAAKQSYLHVGKFTGTCEKLVLVDVSDLIKWIKSADIAKWPSWHKNTNMPAVVADPTWHDMEVNVRPLVNKLLASFPGCAAANLAITTVHPGDFVPFHTDDMWPAWQARVHVPLITNNGCFMMYEGEDHHLKVGMSYVVNIGKPHAIRNEGNASRIHLMFDVVK